MSLKHFQKKLRSENTYAEFLLWSFLRNRKLNGYKFRRQQIIQKYIVDFVCFEEKLIVEVDGLHHAEQLEKDQYRTKQLEKDGYKVLRFWNHDVISDIGLVLHVISRRLLEKHSSASTPHPAQKARHLLPQGEKSKA